MPRNLEDKFSHCMSSLIPSLDGLVILSPNVGRLQLIRQIGRGAWGVVYSARSVSNRSAHFAVKCISTATERCNTFFVQREANLQARVSSTSGNILQIHDVFEEKRLKITFVVTDLCVAGDLLKHILKGSFIRNDELIRGLFLQVVDAVIACHSLGIYHRDLKPENVLCKLDGTLVLTDFGLATRTRFSTGFKTGSTPFMSPELLGGLHRKERYYSPAKADIWALGIILVNLICARAPWRVATFADPAFSWYLRRRDDFFYKAFGVSTDAQYILSRIFTPNPENRVHLLALRDLVLKANSFSRDVSEEERPASSLSFERIFGRSLPRITSVVTDNSGVWKRRRSMKHDKSEGTINSTMAVASLYFPDGPSAGKGDAVDAVFRPEVVCHTHVEEKPRAASRHFTNADTVSSDSGPEFAGPSTPEMPAADRCAPRIVGETGVDVRPPDIYGIEEIDLGEPAFIPPPILSKPAPAHKSAPLVRAKAHFPREPPLVKEGRAASSAAHDDRKRSHWRPPTPAVLPSTKVRSKMATTIAHILAFPPPALLPSVGTGRNRNSGAFRQAANMLGKPVRQKA